MKKIVGGITDVIEKNMKHRTLSNKERTYKNKIIAEYHIKKDGQNFIDNYLQNKSLTYKEVYSNNSLLHSILMQYNFSKLSQAMKSVG